MSSINAVDALDLDGRLLQTLLVVFDEGSVTRAAERLGLTQGAVSHQLDRLRAIVGDALFVKSGRGIAPTVQAQALAQRARVLLEELQGFAHAARFEPARVQMTLTVAANDLQRDLLMPGYLRRLRSAAPGLHLRVVSSGAPRASMLRDGPCQLLVTPRPPDAGDLLQQRLFEDRYVVFHDPGARTAPSGLDDYLASEHVSVVHEPQRALEIDEWMTARGLRRHVVAEVQSFSGVAPLLRGSAALATLPSLLASHLMRGLAMAELPLPCPAMPMYMVWHQRHQDDPLHRWLRAELLATVPQALAAARGG